LTERNPRSFPSRSIFLRTLKNGLDFVLRHPVPIDVRLRGLRIQIVPNLHDADSKLEDGCKDKRELEFSLPLLDA
jgi:hypothetical protein